MGLVLVSASTLTRFDFLLVAQDFGQSFLVVEVVD